MTAKPGCPYRGMVRWKNGFDINVIGRAIPNDGTQKVRRSYGTRIWHVCTQKHTQSTYKRIQTIPVVVKLRVCVTQFGLFDRRSYFLSNSYRFFLQVRAIIKNSQVYQSIVKILGRNKSKDLWKYFIFPFPHIDRPAEMKSFQILFMLGGFTGTKQVELFCSLYIFNNVLKCYRTYH